MHVVALALSEEFLYAGSNKGDIRVRDHSNMEEAPRFGRGKAAVKCLVVYDDEVISAHHDHKIRVWRRSKNDPKQHKLATTLPSVKDYMMNFLPPKNYVQVGSASLAVTLRSSACNQFTVEFKIMGLNWNLNSSMI